MLRQMKYFQAVVRLGSFSEAAYECNISQSAISQQIQALERELGFPLLERKKRKFELTPAGEFFYKKSLVLIADYEQIVRETTRLAGGEQECLKVGFLRCYSGQEFHLALEEFTGKYPDIPVEVFYGNHDELYHMLVKNEIDLAFNDQRRAFSGEYMNMILTSSVTHIEIASRNPIASLDKVTVQELKNMPCILVSSDAEKETEAEFYHTIIGFQGEKLFADNMEEARTLVISGKGFMPSEGTPIEGSLGTNIVRIPLYRGDEPVKRNYCVFWKKENTKSMSEEFAEILRCKFEI
ncbi:MAG: LysR family transcriptional regulator [Lachnospiraceae bacterium]|nr:LysR family transcriptional regulator [Lachnospiraceae bacterium]